MQFGFLSPFGPWLDAGGRWALGTDCVASNDALDVQRELTLVAGQASLEASFSKERERFVHSGGEAEAVESVRKNLLANKSIGGAGALLRGAWGLDLGPLEGGRVRGLVEGALANFLVLAPSHPALFPGDDLARSLAYGSTSGAIEWAVVAGKRRGERSGLQAEVLGSAEYKETLSEAGRRRGELFERAKMTGAPPTS
jgi:cytosine/adenosine deaminase-related metal-dependent hydrolase